MVLTLIYTKTDKWLISKENVDPKIWNQKLYWFMTSLTYPSSQELANFLKEDFHLPEQCVAYIVEALADNNKTYEISIGADKRVSIIPLQIDLLNSEVEIIDWQDRAYYFCKVSNKHMLWVYLGGIAEQCREIILNAEQVEKWAEKGNSFIKELAIDLQHRDSKIYSEAIADNRKII